MQELITTVALTAHQVARIGDTTADLSWIATRWPDLHQLRTPGARSPRSTGSLSPAARAAADALAVIERAERTPDAIGESPVPIDVDVLGTLTDVMLEAADLAERIAETAGAPVLDPPATAYAYECIGEHLDHAAEHLRDAAVVDPEVLDDAQGVAARLRRRVAGALGEIFDGQRLTTVCAWCHGITPQTPVGGGRTLVVRLEAGRPVIVCESGVCAPPDHECRTWIRGRPAWTWEQWEWLNRRLGMP